MGWKGPREPNEKLSHKVIYTRQPKDYDEITSYHDSAHHLLFPKLESLGVISPLSDVCDAGCGTGRFIRWLLPYVNTIIGYDRAVEMVKFDNRSLPFKPRSFDLIIAGWTLSYVVAEQYSAGDAARKEALSRVISEFKRCLRPRGCIVIFETLGCGEQPTRIGSHYYSWLREEFGFSFTSFRTDYVFPSLGIAHRLMRLFFARQTYRRQVRLLQRLPPDEVARRNEPHQQDYPRSEQCASFSEMPPPTSSPCDSSNSTVVEEDCPVLLPETTGMWVLRL